MFKFAQEYFRLFHFASNFEQVALTLTQYKCYWIAKRYLSTGAVVGVERLHEILLTVGDVLDFPTFFSVIVHVFDLNARVQLFPI